MAGTVWYEVPLQCAHCGVTTVPRHSAMQSPALRLLPGDLWVKPGDVLDIGLEDLSDAFRPTAKWPPAETLDALELWDCPACGTAQAALLRFGSEGAAGWRLLRAQAVQPTSELLSQVHGVSEALRDVLGPALRASS